MHKVHQESNFIYILLSEPSLEAPIVNRKIKERHKDWD